MSRFAKNMLWVLVAFLILWTAAITWELHSLTTADDYLTLAINAQAGESETLDLTALFFARFPGTLVTVLLFPLIVLFLSWAKPRQGPRNLPLYLGYLALLAVAGGILVEGMDHYVNRQPPSQHLPGFTCPQEALGMRANEFKTQFPDTRMAIFSILFFQLFFRFGSRALVILPWLGFLTLADIYTGHSWPSDILGALMFAWLFISLVYVSGLNTLYGNLDTRTRAWLAESLRASSLTIRSLSRGIKMRNKGNRLKGAANASSLSDEERRILAKHYDLSNPTVFAPPHKMKLFPIIENGTKCALKKSRIEPDQLSKLNSILEIVNSLSAAKALRVPRIIPTVDQDLAVVEENAAWYLMEWVSGTPLSLTSQQHVRSLSGLLAKLHRSTTIPSSGNLALAEMKRAASIFSVYSRVSRKARCSWWHSLTPSSAEHAESDEVVEKIFQDCEILARLSHYYLLEDRPEINTCWLHRDIHPMNFLIQEDGGLVLLDFDRFRPGLGLLDLVHLFHRASRNFLWDFKTIGPCIDEYHHSHPLSRAELALLLGCILLPISDPKIEGITTGNYEQRLEQIQAISKESKVPMLSNIERDAREDFIRQYASHYDLDLAGLLLTESRFATSPVF